MSAWGMNELRPSRSVNPDWNFSNPACSSKVPLSGCAVGASLPPVRSPRQCIGPWLAMPRRLCVAIGPFIGWKIGLMGLPLTSSSALANGPGSVMTSASGLPRSQARESKSPNTWQLAQAESPWLDENAAS